jgi:hypothetical protein
VRCKTLVLEDLPRDRALVVGGHAGIFE